MKKFLYTIILAAAFSACSDDMALPPALSLHSEKPEILEETAIFRMAFANMADSTERRIPVLFGGTAERGTDYEVSSDAFIFGGESPLDSIIITTLKFGTDKTLEMTVQLPEGMEGGKYLTAGYTLQDYPAYVSFAQDYKILPDSTYVKFSLTDREGKSKSRNGDTDIFIHINQEKSTAVEGVDFTFPDSMYFTIPAGAKEGQLKLKHLKPAAETGRDKIVLSISHEDRFGKGPVQEMEISLMDTLWRKLDGKWACDTLVTDTTYMKTFWGDACTGYDLLPKYKDSDNLTFDLESSLLDPFLISNLRYYFIDDSNFRKDAELSLNLGGGKSAELQTFLFDNTNRFFSSSEESEDKESLIGMRIIEGPEENPDTLDFYIIDYVSKSFMPELESMEKYAPEKPVAASPGLYLNYRFVK